jgi:hypothetical protein
VRSSGGRSRNGNDIVLYLRINIEKCVGIASLEEAVLIRERRLTDKAASTPRQISVLCTRA